MITTCTYCLQVVPVVESEGYHYVQAHRRANGEDCLGSWAWVAGPREDQQ